MNNHGSQDTAGPIWSGAQRVLQHCSRERKVSPDALSIQQMLTKLRTARNSKPLEVLGTYNPYPKEPIDGEGPKQKSIELDITRAKYWLGVGAQPSDSAWDLLEKVCALNVIKSSYASRHIEPTYVEHSCPPA
jgi:ribosomal protein S16